MFGQLHKIICNVYNEAELRILLRTALDENLDVVVGGSNFSEIAFELISWADRTDRTADLIDAIYNDRPNNSDIKKLRLEKDKETIAKAIDGYITKNRGRKKYRTVKGLAHETGLTLDLVEQVLTTYNTEFTKSSIPDVNGDALYTLGTLGQ